MPKCYMNAVRGYRTGKYFSGIDHDPFVMTTRSGLSIKKVPASNRTYVPIKYSPPEEREKNSNPNHKKHHHHGSRHKSLNYMSFVTRFQVSLRMPEQSTNYDDKLNVISSVAGPLSSVSNFDDNYSDSSDTDYNSASDASSVSDESDIGNLNAVNNEKETTTMNGSKLAEKDGVVLENKSGNNQSVVNSHPDVQEGKILANDTISCIQYRMTRSSDVQNKHAGSSSHVSIPYQLKLNKHGYPECNDVFKLEQGTNRVLPLKCDECYKEFLLVSAYTTHLRSHSKQKNKCHTCGKVFTRSWLLKGHLRTHTGERPFKCSSPGCDKAFADKSNLRSHMMIHSVTSKNHACQKCGRAFAQKRYLHKHMLEVCRLTV